MNKKKGLKIISLAITMIIIITFHGETFVRAEQETGIKNAMDDAITGELVALCNELGLDTADQGSEWELSKYPFIPDYLQHNDIAIKKKDDDWVNHKRTDDSHYEVKWTYGSLFANPWPYDLQYKGKDGQWHPTVGDVCARLGVPQVETYIENGGRHADAAYGGRQYNDVNFCEILSILAQGDKGNWKTVDYEEFNEYIRNGEAQNLYYEVEIHWHVRYICEHKERTHQNADGSWEYEIVRHNKDFDCGFNVPGRNETQGMPKDLPPDGIHHFFKAKYWADVRVKPMGLRNLYMLADVAPTDIHKDFNYHTNYEILDHQEDYTKVYMRKDRTLNPIYYDEDRSKKSTIYKELKEYYGKAKGRSAPWYIEEPYNLYNNPIAKAYTEMFQLQEDQLQEFDIQWDGDVNEAQAAILSLAKSAVGRITYEYGGKANGLGWNATFGTATGDDKGRKFGLDCSGFVNWVYRSTTGVTPGSDCGSYKGKQEVSYNELKPGMLGVYYGQATSTRSGNHIGIYAGKDSSGKDMWIHCSGSKGVVMNNYSGFSHFYNPIGL